MLGGHLDSWHSATGATDNAIGCAVMMEAARILQAIGVKPRRTIRVALWGGEEQGLLGSKAYVAAALRHGREIRSRSSPSSTATSTSTAAPAASAARSIFGPPEAGTHPARVLQAVRGLRRLRRDGDERAAAPAAPTARRSTPPACPASACGQDPIEYQSHTWHTNLDTYERIVEDDVKKSAAVIASARVPPRDARPDAAALHEGGDARADPRSAPVHAGADSTGADGSSGDHDNPDPPVVATLQREPGRRCLREHPRAARLPASRRVQSFTRERSRGGPASPR